MAKKSTRKSTKKSSKRSGKRTNRKRSRRPQNKNKHNEVEQIFNELRSFAKSEWGREWVESILEFGRPYRMQRGVRYAQEDRIDNFVISAGKIFATVQGTAPTPYRVKLTFEPLDEPRWQKIVIEIAKSAKILIKLLENKLPQELITIFQDANYSLFPVAKKDLVASCSCPDQAIPCKHIAATILYIARVLDYNPFLLLKLCGKEKEQLMHELKLARSCSNKPITIATKKIREQVFDSVINFETPSLAVQDLQTDTFYKSNQAKIGFYFKKPTDSIEMLDTLGLAPKLEKPDSFNQVFRELYFTTTKNIYNMAISLKDGKAPKHTVKKNKKS
jgi:uncharacterized Zn finger protein